MGQRGLFITFEGIDGAGKTTQIDALENWLVQEGVEVVRTREPGGTPLGEVIRGLLLHEPMHVTTETLLFFAARAEHVAQVIEPALARGAWVLSDRFTDATYAYQVGAKHYPAEHVEALEAIVQGGLQPDHTVLFDVSPEVAAERLARSRELDRFEAQDVEFFRNVRQAYLTRASQMPSRFFILNTNRDKSLVCEELLAEARQWR